MEITIIRRFIYDNLFYGLKGNCTTIWIKDVIENKLQMSSMTNLMFHDLLKWVYW